MNPRWSRAAAAATAVVLLAGCSALSGRDSSDTSFSARPAQPSSSTPAVNAAFTKASTIKAVLADAKKDLAAVYTLDYRDLTQNRSAALAASTGKYADTYRTIVTKAFRDTVHQQKQIQQPTIGTVAVAGLSDHDRKASVYAHLAITTQSKATQTPATRTVSGAVSLKLVSNRWRISKIDENALPKGTLPANRDLAAAQKAVRSAVPKLFDLSRKNFAEDYAASLRVQTGDLLARAQTQRDSVQSTLDKGKYDLSATVAGLSVRSASGTSAGFVVNVKTYHSVSRKTRLGPYPTDLEVTAKYVDGRWLLSASDPVQ